MLPILLCSLLALGISIERLWTLNPRKIAPPNLLPQVWIWINKNQMNADRMKQLRESSPLGEILATGLVNAKHGRDVMKDSIEAAGAHVVYELERYLQGLGTIAMIAPMLGLMGTVIGMIEIFSKVMLHGTGNPSELAGGISVALITTVGGLVVAIPSVIMHRYLLRRVDGIVIDMEKQAIRLVDALHGDRAVKLVDGKDA